jgi:hypothetical protein
MEQLERIDHTAGDLIWVDIEFARRRIAGLAVKATDEGRMILGFLSPNAYDTAVRGMIERVASDAQKRLS